MPWKKETSSREYERQLERDLLIGGVIVLVVGGSFLSGLIYGWPASLSSLLCLVPGAGLMVGVWWLLRGTDRWRRG